MVVQGTKLIWEVAFFHKPPGTLLLVDLLENIGDDYQHTASLYLRICWKLVFRMWNHPKAVPEYQIGWGNRRIVKQSLNRMIDWGAKRIILAHGELIEGNVSGVLNNAWKSVLNA